MSSGKGKGVNEQAMFSSRKILHQRLEGVKESLDKEGKKRKELEEKLQRETAARKSL